VEGFHEARNDTWARPILLAVSGGLDRIKAVAVIFQYWNIAQSRPWLDIGLRASAVRRGWRTVWFLPLAITLSVLLIRPRHLGWHSISDSLWTEDARIFMNQAYALGSQSLITPYQGYLHTFQRLSCLPLIYSPLLALPYLLFAVSYGAFLGLVHVLADRLRSAGLSLLLTAIAITAVLLQPNVGEVYFSITNTQWILGLAFAVYICLPTDSPISWSSRVALAITSVTGPFSVLLTPVLALQMILRRDWAARKVTYLIVAAGAIIQASVLSASERARDSATGTQHWLDAAIVFLTFGGRNHRVVLASTVFWVLLLASLIFQVRARSASGRHPFYLILAATILFGTSIYSVSLWSDVSSVSPIGGGGRYFFIPYALIFLSAFLSSRRNFLLLSAVTLSVAMICRWSFRPDERNNLQWPAFARFAAFEEGVSLPVNPQWDFKPVWAVVPSAFERAPAPKSFAVDVAGNAGLPVRFTTAENCPTSTIIGLEAKVTRPEDGRANLAWGFNKDVSSPENLLELYYPAGEVVMHFAVTSQAHQSYFEFSPSINGRAARVESLRVFCIN
jgi:hypothetical protein